MLQRGMGQTPSEQITNPQAPPSPLQTPTGSADCQWCQQNAAIGMFLPSCWATKSIFGGSCSVNSIPQGYLLGAGAPALPPDQTVIDSQSPDTTINNILTATQQAALQQAVASDAVGPTNSATNPFGIPDIPGLPGSGAVLMWVGIAVLGLVTVKVIAK